ncbi:MAG TPA: four helix bundle protein [Vicinamibacterales bacterium]|nr:four helix bundle protein [Vicinamibacterales bacterium]
MGVRTLRELKAYQATRAFKLEVYRLVASSPRATTDVRFRSQLLEAAAGAEVNIAEGFHRFLAGDFTHFLRISRSSLEEARVWIQDGIDRGYFTEEECSNAFKLADQATRLTVGLIVSLKPFVSPRRRHSLTSPGSISSPKKKRPPD